VARVLKMVLETYSPSSAETLQRLRAVEVLERLGNREARDLLKSLASGAESRLTSESKAALDRLADQ
jgi:HEAT repeat protein